MIRVNLVDIGSHPIDVLGVIYNQLGADPVEIDFEKSIAKVQLYLFTTAQEMNPAPFPRELTFTGNDYVTLGFNINALLALIKTQCNLT